VRLNGFPFRNRKISFLDKPVSSVISLYAAASGDGSVLSIDPEQTAHFPLWNGILASWIFYVPPHVKTNWLPP
jgi:hypothetical protein